MIIGDIDIGNKFNNELFCRMKRYCFKIKGEKHSSTRINTIAPIDTVKLNSINEFVDHTVTVNRLEQAIEQVFTSESKELNVKYTGDFLRWVANDIIDEECDTLADNNLEPKDVTRSISVKARTWFMEHLNSEAGL